MFPDVETLAKKDSDLSTKKYADLRIINHLICMSWVSLFALIYASQWRYITYHLAIIGSFAFLRGALALDFLKNIVANKNDKSN